MVTSSKVIVGLCVAVALVVGLAGTFDYARDRGTRAESTPENGEASTPDPPRVERGRRFPNVDDLQLGTNDDVVTALRGVGFGRVIVLNGGRPTRLTVRLAGEGGTAARTFYEFQDRFVSVGQVKDGVAPLTGRIIRLTPSRIALEVRGVYYLSERGFIVTIASSAADLLERLRWRRR